MDNASLNSNLSKAFTGQPVQEPQVMDNPFPPIGIGSEQPQGQTVAQGGQTLGMQLYDGMDFPSMAKAMNINTEGLHKSPALGRLQLMDRLRTQFGDNYMKDPNIEKLLTAFAKMPNSYGREDERNLLSQTAKSQRTLEALLGNV